MSEMAYIGSAAWRLDTLRANDLALKQRCADLARWSEREPRQDLNFVLGVRDGLRFAASFAETGRFGVTGLCIHMDDVHCQRCLDDAAYERLLGDELFVLEFRAQLVGRRLAELVNRERLYRKKASEKELLHAGDFFAGVATGLGMGRDYLASGTLHTADEMKLHEFGFNFDKMPKHALMVAYGTPITQRFPGR